MKFEFQKISDLDKRYEDAILIESKAYGVALNYLEVSKEDREKIRIAAMQFGEPCICIVDGYKYLSEYRCMGDHRMIMYNVIAHRWQNNPPYQRVGTINRGQGALTSLWYERFLEKSLGNVE